MECKLEKPDIESNQISAEGAQHIAKALEAQHLQRFINPHQNMTIYLRLLLPRSDKASVQGAKRSEYNILCRVDHLVLTN
eukprot:g31639.t1